MALVVISFMNPRRISKSAPVILNALVNVLTGESVLEVTLGFFGFGAEAFLDLGAFSGLATGLFFFFSAANPASAFDDAMQLAYAITY